MVYNMTFETDGQPLFQICSHFLKKINEGNNISHCHSTDFYGKTEVDLRFSIISAATVYEYVIPDG